MLRSNSEIITTLALGAALLMLLPIIVGILIFRYKHNQQKHIIEIQRLEIEFDGQLMQARTEVQESTLEALGKELHDNVGQLLSTTKMLLGVTERNMSPVPETLSTAHETLGTAIRELRTLSKSLTSEWLQQFDLMENLEKELQRLRSTGELEIRYQPGSRLSLKADQQIILFRIIQEALQNVIRHAQAHHLSIEFHPKGEILDIVIQDDGIGFSGEPVTSGIGLMNMKHRIRLLQGQIQWVSQPGEGTKLYIQIPVHNLT